MSYMDDKVGYADLVRQAQLGNQESMNRLVQRVEGRLRAYLYRLTLNYDLTEELVQEALLEMVESLKKLECVDAFWSWLYRTAMGKAQHHFRDEQRKAKTVQMSTVDREDLSKSASPDYRDGLNYMIRKELSNAVFEAVEKLKFRQRNVLVLRCFEQKAYSEIAAIMDCSEMAAQALFFRAKGSIKRQLSKRGFGKESLPIGLGLVARMTAPAEDALLSSSVIAASIKVGLAATIIGTPGTKLGIAVGVAITAIALTVGGITAIDRNSASVPDRLGTNVSGSFAPGYGAFEYPYQLLDAYGPEGDGWKGIEANQVVSVPIVPEEWLVGPPPSEQSSVVLPMGHWVELKFRGKIVDRPGHDVLVVEWGANGEQAQVFITDGADNEYLLGMVVAEASGLQVPTEAGFDIAGISLSFVPRAVRIVGIGGGGGTLGFDLHSVRARIDISQEDY
jgi:RNA polymerase sigma-70 factor (ECF subfamily)